MDDQAGILSSSSARHAKHLSVCLVTWIPPYIGEFRGGFVAVSTEFDCIKECIAPVVMLELVEL